jgi:hypothetical protein
VAGLVQQQKQQQQQQQATAAGAAAGTAAEAPSAAAAAARRKAVAVVADDSDDSSDGNDTGSDSDESTITEEATATDVADLAPTWDPSGPYPDAGINNAALTMLQALSEQQEQGGTVDDNSFMHLVQQLQHAMQGVQQQQGAPADHPLGAGAATALHNNPLFADGSNQGEDDFLDATGSLEDQLADAGLLQDPAVAAALQGIMGSDQLPSLELEAQGLEDLHRPVSSDLLENDDSYEKHGRKIAKRHDRKLRAALGTGSGSDGSSSSGSSGSSSSSSNGDIEEELAKALKAARGNLKQPSAGSAAQSASAAAQKSQKQQKQQKNQKKQQPDTKEDVHAMIKKLQANLAAQQQAKEQGRLLKTDDRDKGNEAVRAGNWQAALRHYNAAIAADPSDVRSFSNRALVFSKLNRSAKVVDDVTQVRFRPPGYHPKLALTTRDIMPHVCSDIRRCTFRHIIASAHLTRAYELRISYASISSHRAVPTPHPAGNPFSPVCLTTNLAHTFCAPSSVTPFDVPSSRRR